jgi:hypothetical protein
MGEYWWVNQSQTYREEREAGILWAPKRSRNGRTIAHWESMAQVRPGDMVIHYANGAIRATGEVLAAAIEAPRPSEVEGDWERDGRLVRAAYDELDEPSAVRSRSRVAE